MVKISNYLSYFFQLNYIFIIFKNFNYFAITSLDCLSTFMNKRIVIRELWSRLTPRLSLNFSYTRSTCQYISYYNKFINILYNASL